MNEPIKTPGVGWGHECHCRCHYDTSVRHCAPCCDKCYEQYDESIWNRDTVIRLLQDTYAAREDVTKRLELKYAERAVKHYDEQIAKYEKWLTKP